LCRRFGRHLLAAGFEDALLAVPLSVLVRAEFLAADVARVIHRSENNEIYFLNTDKCYVLYLGRKIHTRHELHRNEILM
jgi:hypothetical protein